MGLYCLVYCLVYSIRSINVTKDPCFSIAIEWTEGVHIPNFFVLEDLYCVTSTRILLYVFGQTIKPQFATSVLIFDQCSWKTRDRLN